MIPGRRGHSRRPDSAQWTDPAAVRETAAIPASGARPGGRFAAVRPAGRIRQADAPDSGGEE